MVLEVADFRITPGTNAEFEAAIARGAETVIARADGYRSHRIERSVESDDRYLLLIEWDTLEHHTVGFRQGPLFSQWRAIVSPFFAQPPVVEHFERVASRS